MKKELKKETGITLVALVITIIVLLILAGVAIATLSGRDNIIARAKDAKDKYSEGEQMEEMRLNRYSKKMLSTDPNLNFWQKRGLTSSNVQFGKTYTTSNYSRTSGSKTFTDASFTITPNSWTVNEAGGKSFTMDQSTYDEGMSIFGSAAHNEAEIEQAEMVVDILLPVGENSIGYVDMSGPEVWVVEFNESGTTNLYYKYDPDFSNMNFLENDLDFLGTFTAN